ncbi:MAG: HD domain-containing phosphohydrolase [Gammaproteobacteria bacterium]
MHNAGVIVIVDDNPSNLQVLSSMLQQAGFKVRPALSGEIALRAIRNNPPDLILLDIRMPGMDGYETCKCLKDDAHLRAIPVIFISALNDVEDKLAAFRAGGVDYITKPFHAEEVLARVETHLQFFRMQQRLETLVDERTRTLQEALASLQCSRQQYRNMLEQTVRVIAQTVEKRDPYTAGHQFRVADLAAAIGRKIELSAERLEGLRYAATIHDIGKIYLPAEVLNRPGPLNDIEIAMVKTHCEVGRDILRDVEFPWPVAEMIYQHHERSDGSGYPGGLRGDAILQEAKIIAVADVVEAMASHRPYRPALGIEKALDEIRNGAGRLYEPAIAAACLELFETGYRLPSVFGERQAKT